MSEASPEDVAEQAAPVGAEEDLPGAERDLPLEADAADAAEQGLVVDDDEDEHR